MIPNDEFESFIKCMQVNVKYFLPKNANWESAKVVKNENGYSWTMWHIDRYGNLLLVNCMNTTTDVMYWQTEEEAKEDLMNGLKEYIVYGMV